MRKSTCILLGFALVFFCSWQSVLCQATATKADPAAARPAAHAHKLFFWKATGDQGTVYLLGTVHVGKKSLYPLADAIENAYAASDVLVGEIDQSKLDMQKMHDQMTEAGICRPPDVLQNHIGKKTAEELDGYLKRTGQKSAMFSQMKPWMAAFMISILELKRAGFDAEEGIDKHFMDAAAAKGKPIEGLESADFQLQLISGFSEELQDQLLLSSLIDSENTDKDAQLMFKAWQNGDAKTMADVATRDERDYPALMPVMDKLLYDRNVVMADKIADYLRTPKTYFVAVGSAHLVGDRGIVSLLKKKHFKVEQIWG